MIATAMTLHESWRQTAVHLVRVHIYFGDSRMTPPRCDMLNVNETRTGCRSKLI